MVGSKNFGSDSVSVPPFRRRPRHLGFVTVAATVTAIAILIAGTWSEGVISVPQSSSEAQDKLCVTVIYQYGEEPPVWDVPRRVVTGTWD